MDELELGDLEDEIGRALEDTQQSVAAAPTQASASGLLQTPTAPPGGGLPVRQATATTDTLAIPGEAKVTGQKRTGSSAMLDKNNRNKKLSKQQVKAIFNSLTAEQRKRYDTVKITSLTNGCKNILKRRVTKGSATVWPVLGALAKSFVGELVETARSLMAVEGETGPIRPYFIRAAYRKLKAENKIPVDTGVRKANVLNRR
jgi:hypothetical protein